ncbi:hypothetical protein BH11MYX1_BH11MYX1_46120 [soil metagenome]
MRTLAVLVFITIVGSVAIYASQRKTVAHGEVIATDLMKVNAKTLASLDCDPAVPVGVDGATFWCNAVFKRGGHKRLHFQMARTGAVKQIGEDRLPQAATVPAERIEKADPWE